MSASSECWVEPPEPAAPFVPPIANPTPPPGPEITAPKTPALIAVINEVIRIRWERASPCQPPRSLYLGVLEHAELVKLAHEIANFTITDNRHRLPRELPLFEFRGMRVYKVDVLSHIGIGA